MLLIKALDAYKAAHGGAEPSTAETKAAFRAQLRAMAGGGGGGGGDIGANFEEALANAPLAFASTPAVRGAGGGRGATCRGPASLPPASVRPSLAAASASLPPPSRRAA